MYEPPRYSNASTDTILVSAPEVAYIERYFYNYYDFNPKIHTLEINQSMLHTGQPLYAGYPSPSIDAAWEELLKGDLILSLNTSTY